MPNCRKLLFHEWSNRVTKRKSSKRLHVSEARKTSFQCQRGVEAEEITDQADGFLLKTPSGSCVQCVKPLGNLYLSHGHINCRDAGLGSIGVLSDELVLVVLGFLDARTLAVSSSVSKSFYLFTNQDSLWRNLVIDNPNDDIVFKSSWKCTYLSINSQFHDLSSSTRLRIHNFYSDYLFQSWLCANLVLKHEWLERDNIVRRRGISVDDFVSNFEKPNKPVLLEGCIENWPALQRWDRDYLVKACGNTCFSVGPLQMSMENYFRYSDQAREERPLYLFDQKFAEKVPALDLDYEVPVYFREDLFNLLHGERPDYRWLIIGPAGSGSSFHIDPNSTSAWNGVVKGSKKWILFPPDVVPPGVHPSSDGAEVASPVSITEWFMNFYEACKSWTRRPVECICRAGEVVFVPNGWWHLVINLEESIAITQNYVSRRNLLNVLKFLKRPNANDIVSGTREKTGLYDKFKAAIDASYPALIHSLLQEEEERVKSRRTSFWDSVVDSHAGAFKFSF